MDNLTRERSLRMRGAAIFMIVLHNFLHMTVQVKENEFYFSSIKTDMLLDSLSSFSSPLIRIFFSYFGWYGVPVFMFLSGYGLVMKHERNSSGGNLSKQRSRLQVVPYLWKNFLKLFVLLAPCFLIYILISRQSVFCNLSIAQFTMTINLYRPRMIVPGVYWYFGLTLQFYILYLLFYRFRSKTFLIAVTFLMMAASVAVELFADDKTNAILRHNSPLWLPVFLVGVLYARQKTVLGLAFLSKHWGVALMAFTIIWVWSTINPWLWAFSPLFVLPIFGFIGVHFCEGKGLSGFWRHLSSFFSRCFAYLGEISAALFVCHPLVRMLPFREFMGDRFFLVTLTYAVVCVLVAIVYNKCYKIVMHKLLPR